MPAHLVVLLALHAALLPDMDDSAVASVVDDASPEDVAEFRAAFDEVGAPSCTADEAKAWCSSVDLDAVIPADVLTLAHHSVDERVTVSRVAKSVLGQLREDDTLTDLWDLSPFVRVESDLQLGEDEEANVDGAASGAYPVDYFREYLSECDSNSAEVVGSVRALLSDTRPEVVKMAREWLDVRKVAPGTPDTPKAPQEVPKCPTRCVRVVTPFRDKLKGDRYTRHYNFRDVLRPPKAADAWAKHPGKLEPFPS